MEKVFTPEATAKKIRRKLDKKYDQIEALREELHQCIRQWIFPCSKCRVESHLHQVVFVRVYGGDPKLEEKFNGELGALICPSCGLLHRIETEESYARYQMFMSDMMDESAIAIETLLEEVYDKVLILFSSSPLPAFFEGDVEKDDKLDHIATYKGIDLNHEPYTVI